MTISIGYDALLRQAGMTAHDYMLAGITSIDDLFGKGYAKAHPELLAAYMQTAAIDFHSAIIVKDLGGALERIANALEGE
jgi:hypothetical protein